jgi:hypothetical protein
VGTKIRLKKTALSILTVKTRETEMIKTVVLLLMSIDPEIVKKMR